MVDVSFAPYRYFNRLLSPSTVLYTPMLVDAQLLRSVPSTRSNLLAYFAEEVCSDQQKWEQMWSRRPEKVLPANHGHGGLVAQISGCVPEQLVQAVKLIEALGFNAINVNMGCPAESAQSGLSGAALMRHPEFAKVLRSMRKATKLPVTVKCRLGVDRPADYNWFRDFVTNMAREAEIDHFIIHSRVAMLALDPKKNLAVPPLQFDFAHRLRRDLYSEFGNAREIKVEYNGGISNMLDCLCRGWGIDKLKPPTVRPSSTAIARVNLSTESRSQLVTHSILEIARQLHQRGLDDGEFLKRILTSDPVVDGVMIGRLSSKELVFPAKYDALLAVIEKLRECYDASTGSPTESLATFWLRAWNATSPEALAYLEMSNQQAEEFRASPRLIVAVSERMIDFLPANGKQTRRLLLQRYLDLLKMLGSQSQEHSHLREAWIKSTSYQHLSSLPKSVDIGIPTSLQLPNEDELPYLASNARLKAHEAKLDSVDMNMPLGAQLIPALEWHSPLHSLCANSMGSGAAWRKVMHDILTQVQHQAKQCKWSHAASEEEKVDRIAWGLRAYASRLAGVVGDSELLCATGTNSLPTLHQALDKPIVSEEVMAEIVWALVGVDPKEVPKS